MIIHDGMVLVGEWGVDEPALARLRETWPHAAHFLAPGDHCQYPLWNIRAVAGGYVTEFHDSDQHRYVCGAPCLVGQSYCPSCFKRLNEGKTYVRKADRALAQGMES